MQTTATKALPFILLALAALSLAACNGTTVFAAVAAGGIYGTRSKAKPPADMSKQIARHESWCYETLGEPQCFTQPQKGAGSRLINVEPQNRYPLTARAYDDIALRQ
jgi:hypothetical protein